MNKIKYALLSAVCIIGVSVSSNAAKKTSTTSITVVENYAVQNTLRPFSQKFLYTTKKLWKYMPRTRKNGRILLAHNQPSSAEIFFRSSKKAPATLFYGNQKITSPTTIQISKPKRLLYHIKLGTFTPHTIPFAPIEISLNYE